MLTIHPNFTNNVRRTPAFGRADLQKYAEDVEYIDYDSNDDYYKEDIKHSKNYFNIDEEKNEAKKELDLWEQTKVNVDQIAQKTDMVPGLKTGTKVLSGLTAVAIGWGGLRWGTVGTLEVLSKIGKTDFMQSVGSRLNSSRKYISRKCSDLGSYIKDRKWYKNAGQRISGWKNSFCDTSVGQTLTGWKTAIKENSLYQNAVKFKNNTVDYFKNLNYKRVFVETMGVAGGGTAAVNLMSNKTVDGRTQEVCKDENGNYTVNGRQIFVDEGGVNDAA